MQYNSVAEWLQATFSPTFRKVLEGGEKALRAFLEERDKLAFDRDIVRHELKYRGIYPDAKVAGGWLVDSTDEPIACSDFKAALTLYEEMIEVEAEDKLLLKQGSLDDISKAIATKSA